MALLVVGAGVLIGAMMNRDGGAANPPAPTPAPENPLLTSPDTASTEITTPDVGELSAMLGNQDAVIAGLSKDSMVKVDNLSVTPGLNQDWMNILLLGSDARRTDESSRTDTMIICSINTKSGEVKLTSILRDMAVDFDDIGQYSGTYRINAANYFGGPELAMKTVNECFGMNIQNYVMVDFTSFSIIAEQLGGIELDITEAEMNEINHNAVQQAKMAYKSGIDESALEATNVLLEVFGEKTHLNGRQALAYARIRKLDSDITRTERQRRVLIALMDKLKTRSAVDILALSSNLQGYVQTNMSINDIITIALQVVGSGLDTIEQLRLPANDTFKQETRHNQSMLYDTDWATNTQLLHSFIYD